jgi:thiamine-monophosphate kinase
VGDRGEFDLIRLLTDDLPRDARTIVGVGDDCAVYEIADKRPILATCDMLIEDVHFSRKTASAFLIGCKALACSLSDIAAMGGHPLFAMVSLGLPDSTPTDFAQDLYVGMRSMCRDYEVVLVGGDTVRSPDKIVIDVSMIGECRGGNFVLRSGAKTGDAIVVTGHLGNSAAGLDLLTDNAPEPDIECRNELVEAHLAPEPRCAHGAYLAENFKIHAMIDLSDGLAGDLGHICESSGLGACIREAGIPISDALRSFCRGAETDPLRYALGGGEDYELLFTLAPSELERLMQQWPEDFDIPLTHIGDMGGKGIRLVSQDGSERPLDIRSFDHFRKR